MKHRTNPTPAAFTLRNVEGFTLIELLTVIAIIAVLAGLLFPAIKSALQKAEIAQAQNDIKSIETALKMFYTDYGKWPNCNGGTFDFSYGAIDGSSSYGPSLPSPPNQLTGYVENYWLMNVLQAIQDNNGTQCGNGGTLSSGMPTPVNSHGTVYLTIPAKSLHVVDTVRGYADFVDPWKNPYQITVDTGYDNTCTNLANTAKNPTAKTPLGEGAVWVTNTIAVWSFGPPGPYGPHTAKDWITSWQ